MGKGGMRPWTGKEEQSVIALYREGKTARTIAEEIERSKQSVQKRISYLRRQGVDLEYRQSNWSREEVSALLFQYQQGYSTSRISSDIGRSEGAIRTMLKQLRRGNVEIPYRRLRIRRRKDVV